MTVADVYRALWRHRFFIVLMTVGLVAAAWFLTSRQTEIYEAGTLIRIQERVEQPGTVIRGLDPTDRPAETYAQIAETDNLATRIAEDLDGEVPVDDVDLDGGPVDDLDLLWIVASHPDPEVAQAVANAAPPALQDFIRDSGTLREQVVTIEEAGLPEDPAKPNMRLNLALAVVLGLVFNSALALLIDLLSDRLPDSDELEAMTGQPVLATLPTLKFTRRSELGSFDQLARPPTPTDGNAIPDRKPIPESRTEPTPETRSERIHG